MKTPSLIGRIVRWQVGLMLVCWVVLVGWLLHAMTAYENGDLDQRMKYFAEILAETASGAAGVPKVWAGGVMKAMVCGRDASRSPSPLPPHEASATRAARA